MKSLMKLFLFILNKWQNENCFDFKIEKITPKNYKYNLKFRVQPLTKIQLKPNKCAT